MLRLRWLAVLGMGLGIAAIFAALKLLGGDRLAFSSLSAAVLGSAIGVVYRRQGVTVMEQGLFMKVSYTGGIFCEWSEIAVERRQLGPLTLDQLHLRGPVRRWTRGNANAPPEFTWRPTRGKRLLIGLYDRDWRTGPVGAALIAHGVSLEASTPGSVG